MSISRRDCLKYVFAGVLHGAPFGSVQAAGGGRFVGRIVAQWLPAREMKLLEKFEYISSDGTRWPVPVGTVVDGASIPQAFWSLIGGPFEGLYREASVIHDCYCQVRTRADRVVHNMFNEAMLTSGVNSSKRLIMHQAVLRFGPRWSDPALPPDCQYADPEINPACPRRA